MANESEARMAEMAPVVAAPWAQRCAMVAAALDVDVAAGLGHDEAVRRAQRHGPNELIAVAGVPLWRRLAAQLTDRLVLLLVAAAVVSLVVLDEAQTAVAVLVVVAINTVVGLVNEGRATHALAELADLMVPTVTVRRHGPNGLPRPEEVPATEVVPGDVVILVAGDRVPADGRLVETVTLEIDESPLTGEALPVAKEAEPDRLPDGDAPVADRTTMAHAGTLVVRGRADLVVTATGMATEVGGIAGLLAGQRPEPTPLQRQLDGLARNLARLALGIVAVVVAIGLLRGASVGDVMLTAVALAVASIPEGLPAITALTLALGVRRMARRQAIVKRLSSVETLGCAQVVCTDKTGTLTVNRMVVRQAYVGGAPVAMAPGASVDDAVAGVLGWWALCSDAGPDTGDPTEVALVQWAVSAGVDVDALRRRAARMAEVPFDPVWRLMATVHRGSQVPTGGGAGGGAAGGGAAGGGADVVVLAKGSVEAIVDRAVGVVAPGGAVVTLDEGRQQIEDAAAAMVAQGLRVLALGMARHQSPGPETEVAAFGLSDVGGLVVVSLVGLADPPRPDAAEAVAEARRAGIAVRMVTGDHAGTASAIATEVGIGGVQPVVCTGGELDAMDDTELDAVLPDIEVFARVSPVHKLRLVQACRRRGLVVAMTGDGVNDAPALAEADIGVAMGKGGTAVAREASDMVLADDRFATIVAAVREGRAIYANIVRFVRFQVATTMGFAVLFLLVGLTGVAGGTPFAAVAILWVNVIMDGPPALTLGLDPPDTDVMDRAPRDADEPVLTPSRWVAIGWSAVVMALVALAAMAVAPGPVADVARGDVATTMGFTTFVAAQFFNLFNVRSERRSALRRASLANRALLGGVAVVAVLQVLVVQVGWLQPVFSTTSLSVVQWATCVALASVTLWAEEARKLVVRVVGGRGATSRWCRRPAAQGRPPVPPQTPANRVRPGQGRWPPA